MADKKLPDEWIADHTLAVRYVETDQMGVVYHTNYLVWFHEARDALLAQLGFQPASLESRGYRFPIVDVGCRYLRSARYGDQVTVTARLVKEHIARMRFRYEVRHAQTKRLLATGHSVSVMTDHSGKLLLRLPQDVENILFAANRVEHASPAKIEELQQ